MRKRWLKHQIVLMCIFASAVYFMSYITRINYNTVLAEIPTAEDISRSLPALPLTASFITYGFEQIINSCTYVGAALSTYGFAAVSESCGWNVTLILWGVIAFIGMLCCFIALRKWNRA